MLTIQGYTNFDYFHLRCWRMIHGMYLQCMLKNFPNGEWKRSKYAIKNTAGASQDIALKICRDRWGGVTMISPSGKLLLIPWQKLDIDYYIPAGKAIKNIRENPLAFFKENGWQESFSSEEVYREWNDEFEDRRLINWNVGCLDVGLLNEKMKRYYDKHEASESEQSKYTGMDHRLGSGILSELTRYHGCSLIVPHGWDADLTMTVGKDDVSIVNMPPWERILDFVQTNPGSVKRDVKKSLFPEASARAFASWWRAAAELEPRLATPGRRPSSLIS